MQPNRTKFALLGFLSRAESSAYQLQDTIACSVANFWRENDGRVYPILAKMQGEGLVTSREEANGGRKSRVYRITETGIAALDAWLCEDPVPRPPRSELLLKMFFGYRQAPETLHSWLEDKVVEADATLVRLGETRHQLDALLEDKPEAAFWLMTLDYGERHAAFEKSWALECRRRLSEPNGLAPPSSTTGESGNGH
jgi:PadR family transcriptional regulator, regulatory protein AphA